MVEDLPIMQAISVNFITDELDFHNIDKNYKIILTINGPAPLE
jgi:hypothetical protein